MSTVTGVVQGFNGFLPFRSLNDIVLGMRLVCSVIWYHKKLNFLYREIFLVEYTASATMTILDPQWLKKFGVLRLVSGLREYFAIYRGPSRVKL